MKLEKRPIPISELVSVEEQLRLNLLATLDRRIQGPVLPSAEELIVCDYDGMKFSRRYLDILTLIILLQYSDYFGDWREYLIFEIRNYLETSLLFPELDACLNSRDILVPVILNFTKLSPRQLFGNIIQRENLERVLSKVHLRMIHPSKSRRAIRHRGYRDHGTLRPSHEKIESFDWTFTARQNLIELERSFYHQKVTILTRLGGTWAIKKQVFCKKGGEANGNSFSNTRKNEEQF